MSEDEKLICYNAQCPDQREVEDGEPVCDGAEKCCLHEGEGAEDGA